MESCKPSRPLPSPLRILMIHKHPLTAHIPLAPFPCVGSYLFAELVLFKHPAYPDILNRLKSDPSSVYLKVGCGLAQDIRKLIADGARGLTARDGPASRADGLLARPLPGRRVFPFLVVVMAVMTAIAPSWRPTSWRSRAPRRLRRGRAVWTSCTRACSCTALSCPRRCEPASVSLRFCVRNMGVCWSVRPGV